MRFGRIGKVKKTKLLKLSAFLNTILCAFFILFSIFYFKNYDYWFFIFIIFVALYLLSKAILFKSDSSCYFGSLLFMIGVFGLLSVIFSLKMVESYYLFITAAASILVAIFFRQPFHMLIAGLFAYEGISLYLFQAKIINLTIFLVLNAILFFIFLTSCVIIFKKLKKC